MDCATRLGNAGLWRAVRTTSVPNNALTISRQTQLPKEGKPLYFILYADKSKLSSFGTQKGYPIVARIGNIAVGVRNGSGIGGGRVVGWVPIVCDNIQPECSYCLKFIDYTGSRGGW